MTTNTNSQNRYPKLGCDDSLTSSADKTLIYYLIFVSSGTVFYGLKYRHDILSQLSFKTHKSLEQLHLAKSSLS